MTDKKFTDEEIIKGTYYFKLSSSRKSIGGINNGVYREKY